MIKLTGHYTFQELQSAREKKAGAFDSEIPALIPSIGVGIGGRADREDRSEDFPHELPR